MDARIAELAQRAGVTPFDYQREFLEAAWGMQDIPEQPRVCLYYKTGAGKSFTALAAIAMWGYTECVVVAPPSTHKAWAELGDKMGVLIAPLSHAKFRMKDTKLSRNRPIIADEMHMFGGQKGQGWRKLDKLAQHLQAPLVLASATPNYNDAERCYCIQHVLDPDSCRGGFLQFLYQHCETKQNPFSMQPDVLGFLHHPDAAAFLAALPGVYYLADDLVYTIVDRPYLEAVPTELLDYGYNRRQDRMIASIIEETHTVRYQGLVNEEGFIHGPVMQEIYQLLRNTPGAVLIYADHATIAEAVTRTLKINMFPAIMVTGSTSKKNKEATIQEFRAGFHKTLVGTATLATGTDGLDRVCDTLLILDDTSDDSLRRQLIGRIMPRGDFVSLVDKRIIRLVPS